MTDEPVKKDLPTPPPPIIQDMVDELMNKAAPETKSLDQMMDEAGLNLNSTEDTRAEHRVFAPKLPSITFDGTRPTKDTTARDIAAGRKESPAKCEPSEGKVVKDKRIVCWVETKTNGDRSLWVIRKGVGEHKQGAGDVWGHDYTNKEEAATDAFELSRKNHYKYNGIADWQ